MTTTSPIAPAAAALEPEWIRVAQAVAWSGMSRSSINYLVASGKIKAVNLRVRGTERGVRLISFPSFRGFLDRLATGGEVAQAVAQVASIPPMPTAVMRTPDEVERLRELRQDGTEGQA